jgi:hypothetical protein
MKLTLVWQSKCFAERDWIPRLFADFIGEQVHNVSDDICEGSYDFAPDNCLLVDSYLHCRPADYYKKFRGKNAFLLHLCDETYEGGYAAYENFRAVFRFYYSGFFNPRRVLTLPLGFSSGFESTPTNPQASDRPYLWSFLGAANKSSRPEMIRALAPIQPNFTLITDQGSTTRFGKREYERFLRDSVFVPSSMGNVNLECFRIYESLESGAIPILEKRTTLDYFTHLFGKHPLPTFSSWPRAAKFLHKIGQDKAALDALQAECMSWWQSYQQSIHQRIAEHITNPPTASAGPYVHWQRKLPAAQVVELLRHHTLPAIARRVKVQLHRLKKEGKLRKTTGA